MLGGYPSFLYNTIELPRSIKARTPLNTFRMIYKTHPVYPAIEKNRKRRLTVYNVISALRLQAMYRTNILPALPIIENKTKNERLFTPSEEQITVLLQYILSNFCK